MSLELQSSGRTAWRCPSCALAARAPGGMLAAPNNPFVTATVQALAAGGAHARSLEEGWRTSRAGAPYYEFWNGSGGRIKVHIADDIEDPWSHIGTFSPLTIDVALAVLSCISGRAHRAMSCAPRRASVHVGAPAVLAVKRYRRFGEEREAFARVVEAEIDKLLALRIDVINYPGFDPSAGRWSRTGVFREDLALIELGEEASPAGPRDCERGRALRLGAWTEHWLNAAGPMWTAPLPQSLIALDHRENRGAEALAKKIGILVTLSFAARRDERRQTTNVRALLRRVGEMRRPGSQSAQHMGRLADRLEEALWRLADQNLIRSSLADDMARVRRAEGRRWRADWLDADITLMRPTFLRTEEEDDVPVRRVR